MSLFLFQRAIIEVQSSPIRIGAFHAWPNSAYCPSGCGGPSGRRGLLRLARIRPHAETFRANSSLHLGADASWNNRKRRSGVSLLQRLETLSRRQRRRQLLVIPESA